VNGQNVIPEIYEVKEKMKSFSSLVISGKKRVHTGKQFTDINIGIGALTWGQQWQLRLCSIIVTIYSAFCFECRWRPCK
jgi:hypothetical protein